jgi:exopolyphosphatase/guanosine-5'-triphosphate,3'-diphosphate pyrophosphatase
VYAARLHDIGVRISPDRHHKHGAYLVEHADLRGFSPDEVAILASVVRFQRGGPPKPAYPPFRGLEDDERARSAILSGILRVAHALGRGLLDEPRELTFERRSGRIEIVVAGPAGLRGHIADAQDRSALLARTLGREIEVAAGHAEAAFA